MIMGRKILDQLKDCQIIKDSTVWNEIHRKSSGKIQYLSMLYKLYFGTGITSSYVITLQHHSIYDKSSICWPISIFTVEV